MGSKVARPVHPGSLPNPVCLLTPLGFCWLCTFFPDPNNKYADDCPQPPEGVQLSDVNNPHLFIPAGHLEYEGIVYNVEPGVCIDNGGTWVTEPGPGGCNISKDALINANLSTAVVDNVVARDLSSKLAAEGNSEHDQFVSNLGFLTLVLCVLIFFAWAKDLIKLVNSKRYVQSHGGYTLDSDPVVKNCKETNDRVIEDRKNAIDSDSAIAVSYKL